MCTLSTGLSIEELLQTKISTVNFLRHKLCTTHGGKMANSQHKPWSRSMSTGNISNGYSTGSRRGKQIPKSVVSPRKGKEAPSKTHTAIETQLKHIYREVMGEDAVSSSLTCAKEISQRIQQFLGQIKGSMIEFTETRSLTIAVKSLLEDHRRVKSELETTLSDKQKMKTFYSEKLNAAKNDVQIRILELETEKTEKEELRKRIQNLHTKIADYKIRMSQNQRDIRSLEDEKQKMSDEIQGYQKKIERLEEDKRELTDKVSDIENENQKLKDQNESYKTQIQHGHWKWPKTNNPSDVIHKWILSHPPQNIDNQEETDSTVRPVSAISAGVNSCISRSATEYSHRPMSSHSEGFSCVNSDISSSKNLQRPQSSESTNFSCANSGTSTLSGASKRKDRKLHRTLSKNSDLSFANSTNSEKDG